MQALSIALNLALLIVCGAAAAQQPQYLPGSPAANFRDDALLISATAEVARMPRHQLDLLTDLLATCMVTELYSDDAIHRPCDIARQRYYVAYGDFSDTHKILTAIEGIAAVVRFGGKGHDFEISRLVKIHGQFSSHITIRNQRLNGGTTASNTK